jgi:predicted DNA-binding protein YlxM (UPF0122 family)
MAQIDLSPEEIVEVFKKCCESKNYQVEPKKDPAGDWRLDISNIREKTLIIVYHTGSVVLGGKKNDLRAEFENLKQEFMANPQQFLSYEVKKIKACATRYEIVSPDIRRKIREGLEILNGAVEINEKPATATEYRAKITRNRSSLTMTQYSTGTLLLQGKTEDKLFDDGCTWIEKIANPSDKEVIARFISADEKSLQEFSARYTAQLLEIAENNVKENIGDLYNYLEPYDRKWFVASECLCLSKVPLPEFSPLVMPASKAFEGFVKKLLVGIGLFDVDHFKTKDANFSALNDVNNPKRKSICDKEKHADTMLRKIDLCLKTYRHFMMHSDESKITKVDSEEEGEEKVATIFKDTREIFEYFNDLYRLFVT